VVTGHWGVRREEEWEHVGQCIQCYSWIEGISSGALLHSGVTTVIRKHCIFYC
jgi:hypothetical protein